MKHFNINIGALALVMALGTFTSCQQENEEFLLDEETSSVKEKALQAISCSRVFRTWTGPGTDHNIDVNKTIDDRSCTYNYTQSTYGSNYDWGVYRLNSADNTTGLQTRIERETRKVNKIKNGNFVQVKGWVRILAAGEVSDGFDPDEVKDADGTYFIQAKGKHDVTQSPEPNDPATALFLAKPVRRSSGSVIKVNGKIKEFDIWREEVTKLGGGVSDRKMTYITRVGYNKDFFVDIKTGINSSGKAYVKHDINGATGTLFLPTKNTRNQNAKTTELKLRMGAYRCKGTKATILWRKDVDQVFRNN